MNIFKKTILGAALAAASSGAFAGFVPFAIDVNGVGFAGRDVEIGEYFDFIANSFIQNTFTSATTFNFTDVGVLKVVGVDGTPASVFAGHEITAVLTGGTGTGGLSGAINFTGGTLEFYSDVLQDYATVAGSAGGLVYGANNGTLIGTFNLIAGNGAVNASGLPNGDISLTFQATSLLANTWFDMAGNDLSLSGDVFNFITTNASRIGSPSLLLRQEIVSQLGGYDYTQPGFNVTPHNFIVSNNGQDRVDVPEPDSIALIGMGLLGLGWLSRKKQAKLAA